MPDISRDVILGQLTAVLREACDGSPQASSYFSDGGLDGSLIGTLDRVTAAEASHPWGNTSIAAHAGHVQFGLSASAAWIRGDRAPRDWQESWASRTVDEPAWKRMREQIRAGFDELRQAMEKHALDSAEAFGGAVGAIAHIAYHLGAIRQKVAMSRMS